MRAVLLDFADIFICWRTWFLLANQDIKMRYLRSKIGPFWISISLAAMVTGLALLYSQIFSIEFHDYLFWIACSLLIWTLVAGMVTEASSVLVEAENTLRNVKISQAVLATRMIYRQLIVFAHNILVIAVLMALFGFRPTWAIFLAIPGLILLLLIGLFYTLSVTAFCLRFRDVSQVINSMVQIMFFMTPIIWQPAQGRVPALFVQINPFYHMVELVRAPLLGHPPQLVSWVVSLGIVFGLVLTSTIAVSITRTRVFVWL